jgi:23S rRNA (uracil1939-C5)-methyltransferase
VLSFFQGNRFLLRDLVALVVHHIPQRSEVVDLYAGAGLFAMAAATVRDARVTAVEGDPHAAQDLLANAAQARGAVTAVHQPVEAFLDRSRQPPGVLIVDPPRTGMSKASIEAAVGLRADRVIYVSCDVATLARDLARFVGAGYQITRIDAFDLFPNTPHVETVVGLELA